LAGAGTPRPDTLTQTGQIASQKPLADGAIHFLDLDDDFRTRQAQRETGIVPLKTGNFVGQRIRVT
jgi:hypothetical protein